MVLVVKNPTAHAGNIRDAHSVPGLGRSPGGGHGNPLHYSCLENPRDRGAWWATVHGVTKSQTWLMWLSTRAHMHNVNAMEVVVCTQHIQVVLFGTFWNIFPRIFSIHWWLNPMEWNLQIWRANWIPSDPAILFLDIQPMGILTHMQSPLWE